MNFLDDFYILDRVIKVGLQFSSVAQLCPTLGDSRSPPKLMSIVSVISPTISSSVVPFSSCPQSFPASGSFPVSQLSASGGQSIGVSASASVLPMNIKDWLTLRLTGLISLLSKGLSRVFSNTTVQKYQFISVQLYSPALTSIHDYWKNHNSD